MQETLAKVLRKPRFRRPEEDIGYLLRGAAEQVLQPAARRACATEIHSSRDAAEIVEFLTSKWERELEYALRNNLWPVDANRIAVRFQYECQP